MIEYRRGDILTADVEAVVNTVNCVGVMGRGISLQFKNAFPDNFKAYAAACRRGQVQPGGMFVFETGQLTNPRVIFNFPTKRHWRQMSRMEDIDSGLKALVGEIRTRKIRSIAIPALGSGLGGLEWSMVRERIEDALRNLHGIEVIIFEPKGEPEAVGMVRSPRVPRMTLGRAALVSLIHRYLEGLLDPLVTLLEVHKLTYFMQVAGQPLQLRFNAARYGPYAENLGHVLRAVEGHLISGYGAGGDAPGKHLELLPGAVDSARAVLEGNIEMRARFDRVAELVEGFETPFGLELLATTHWVVKENSASIRSIDDVISLTYAWDRRKRKYSNRQILLAVDVLSEGRWLDRIAAGNM